MDIDIGLIRSNTFYTKTCLSKYFYRFIQLWFFFTCQISINCWCVFLKNHNWNIVGSKSCKIFMNILNKILLVSYFLIVEFGHGHFFRSNESWFHCIQPVKIVHWLHIKIWNASYLKLSLYVDFNYIYFQRYLCVYIRHLLPQ